jgi:serine/threonine protein kinase/tetratricopeptide (TPR) repeat protein
MLTPGIRFGPYEIGAPIGRGGMGEVYRARDARLDRDVALKVLPAALGGHNQSLQRFEREARAIAALNHPNICTIHDVGEATDPERTRFIVMELLEGETLRQRLERGPLDAAALVDISIPLTSALDAAHKKGIVHRDLKPSNIFLTSHGPKLLDFGLATPSESIADVSRQSTMQALTETGTTLGTAAYMSPEQLRAEPLDARTDLFSLGAVLYEMATGSQAFHGSTSAVIASAILEKTPRPVRGITPSVPVELERIIGRMLEKDRDLRYQSAADLRSDLERLRRDLNANVPATSSHETQARPPIRVGRRRLPWTAAGVGIAVVVAIAAAIAYRASSSAAVISSLAVVPFAHESADPGTEYLSSGITEGLINSLSQLPRLRVLSRNAVIPYRGRAVDPSAVGRELQVDAVITGRVTPQGDTLDVQSELVDVASGAQLWGKRYSRPLSALLTLQEEMASDISELLRRTRTGEDERRLAQRRPENAEAYRLYLRGRHYFDQRTEIGTRLSIESFQEAIRKDPDYALAYAGLANAYVSSDTVLPPPQNVVLAKSAAVKALASDDSLAEVQTAVGRVLQNCDWDWAGAERAFKRAIDLDPRYAEAHHMYSHYLTPVGRLEESVREARVALDLDPLDVLLNVHLGWAYLHARRYDEAVAQSLEAIAMDPNLEVTYTVLGRAYLGKKMYAEALAEFEKMLTLAGGVATGPDTYLGYTYAVMGRKPEALQKLAILRERYKQKQASASAYDLAVVYMGLSETDQALEWLERALLERSGGLLQLKADLLFDPIRSDARFASIIGRLGLPPDSAQRP